MDTKIMRITLTDGTFYEREFREDWDNEAACHYMLNNLPQGCVAPKSFCQLDGDGNGWDMTDMLERALEERKERKLVVIEEEGTARINLDVRGLKTARLCELYIKVEPHCNAEESDAFLRSINRELAKRIAFRVFIAAIAAYIACIGGGVLTLHLAGGVMETASLHWAQGLFAAGAVVIALALNNRKLIAIERWAAAATAHALKTKRERLELEQESDGDSE